ncbi:hypothetical protein RUM44_001935 [Polyplax serrata]|uniref:Coiled-coil domain-containing protein n=1 Tax=Polyplax serrata TaxID=468196 RepID=A0ABR1AN74_POLSC
MNCKIESMKENCKNHVDTLPPRGRVNEVRREWLVHEDGALAYRLQDEEIKQHLIGNRSRNTQIREDFPRAKDEQQREAEEAIRLHQQLLYQQEQQDAKIAEQLAYKIEKEEEERRRMLEEEDKELAKLLQEQEQSKVSKRERDLRELETHTPKKEQYYYDDKRNLNQQRPLTNQRMFYYDDNNLSDINNVGLPLQDEIVKPMRSCNLSSRGNYQHFNKTPAEICEDEARRIQEEKDEEYARYLQEKENLDTLDTVNKDRLLAIETQDKELARLLQEKERAKARRARERAKQKAAMKRMQEEGGAAAGSAEIGVIECENVMIKVAETVPVNCQRNSECEAIGHKEHSAPQVDVNVKNVKPKPRYPDPEEIVELPLEGSLTTPVANIAAALDPTYTRESLERNPRQKKSCLKTGKSSEEFLTSSSNRVSQEDLTVDGNAPPYMPIQGQRRLPEKKGKQKDGCKQQ